MEKIKLVCFDVDGTLVEGTSWWILTKNLGCSVEDTINTFGQATKGEISFAEAERIFTKRYQNSGNANKTFIEKLFQKIEIKNKTKDIISYLKEKGYIIYLISGAIDMYVGAIAKKIGVDGFYANSSLEFDEKGVLKKINYRENQGEVKVEQLQELIKKLGISTEQVVFVGDSENDIEAFKFTKHGIAINSANEELKKVSWRVINSLLDIKNIL
jgi:HAD superfamily PSPase-like hydrolase